MNVRLWMPMLASSRPRPKCPVNNQEVGIMQNVSTMIRRPGPVGTAAASGLLAFLAGAVIALGAPAVVTGLSVTSNSSAPVSTSAVGAEQTAHDRSEQGLGGSASVGGQQIAHNRSESGLADK
jgi:hypothetical protein